jgi:hypothetical protein
LINLDLSSYPDRLAVLYSGGADSTLLYYLTVSGIMQDYPNKTLDLIMVDRYNNPILRATQLYNRIRTGIKDTVSELKVISLPADTPGNLQVLRAVEMVKDNYDTILWGVNKYPDDASIRPRNSSYQVDFGKFTNQSKLKLPFAEFNKADIISAFFNLGITDILYATHSCGEPLGTPCGKCFNCRERIWAFQQLGLAPNLGI